MKSIAKSLNSNMASKFVFFSALTLCTILFYSVFRIICASPLQGFEAENPSRLTHQDKIHLLINEQKELAALLKQSEEEEGSVLGVLSGLNNSITALKKNLFQTRSRIKRTKQDIVLLKEAIKQSENQARIDQNATDQQLLNMYRLQKIRQKTLFPGQGQFLYYFRNQKLVEILTKFNMKTFLRLTESINEMEMQSKELEKSESKLEELLVNENETYRQLFYDQKLQLDYLKQIKSDRRKNKQYLVEIAQELKKLNRLLDSIEQPHAPLPKVEKEEKKTIGFKEVKGELSLPAQGTIIQKFGASNLSKFPLFKQGILVGTKENTEVDSILSGKAVFSGPFHNYGNMLIVDHGRGSFSLYGNLEKIFVQVNNSIEKGQKLGLTAYNPLVNQYLYYFEMRYQGKSIDPLPWLKPKKQNATSHE